VELTTTEGRAKESEEANNAEEKRNDDDVVLCGAWSYCAQEIFEMTATSNTVFCMY